MKATLYTLLFIALPTAIYAQQVDYVIDGLYPGMPAAQAKAAGYSLCEKTIDGDIRCRKEKAIKESFSVPIKSADAYFESPFTVISKVQIKFDSIKKSASCGKGKGPWGNVLGPECFFDIKKEISKTYGPPVKPYGFTTWHKCGRYAMSLDDQTSVLTITDRPDEIDTRKYECEKAKKEQQAREAEEKTASDFMRKMK